MLARGLTHLNLLGGLVVLLGKVQGLVRRESRTTGLLVQAADEGLVPLMQEVIRAAQHREEMCTTFCDETIVK
jgi:hypothetical protein